jgi:hypothetical protein
VFRARAAAERCVARPWGVGVEEPAVPVEHGASKDAAAELTRMADDVLERLASESLAERRKLREESGLPPA